VNLYLTSNNREIQIIGTKFDVSEILDSKASMSERCGSVLFNKYLEVVDLGSVPGILVYWKRVS